MIKVGDLVRIALPFLSYEGQMGIITKVPRTERGVWAILLTSGELFGTLHRSWLEVISATR